MKIVQFVIKKFLWKDFPLVLILVDFTLLL